MAEYADKIHALGLKLGLYGAASGVTCGNEPGQLYNEDIDAETYASWGLDYLKSDNCASYALDSSVRFGAMRCVSGVIKCISVVSIVLTLFRS